MNEIIYLDAAATMQKPGSVIGAQVDFLQSHYANAGRGICARASYVDQMVSDARRRVAVFMGADAEQIVFTAGATDGLNRVVHLIGDKSLRVAVSDLDHHSARLPWVMNKAADIVVWPLDDDFNLDVARVPAADVYVMTAMSNVMGRAQDVAGLVVAARRQNPDAIIIVDAAQYIAHEKINAAAWDADFICWSGHKIGADTGVGIMYIKNPSRWNTDKFGGGMVQYISADKMVFNNAPDVFEAGTLPLTQIAGLSAAIDFLETKRPDLDLIKYMYDELSDVARVKILTQRDATLLTFVVDGMHPIDVGALIGARGVCVRAGNMCASWMMRALGIDGAVRISVGAQSTRDDAVQAIDIIKGIVK